MIVEPEALRQVMRSWTTGVAILLSRHQEETYGITVNSLSSLALDPPLIAVTLMNDSYIHRLVSRSHAFTINILSAAQRELAEIFAGKLQGKERMTSVEVQSLPSGSVVLRECLSWLDCRVTHIQPVGPNTLFFAEVVAAQVYSLDDPLVYHNRAYHRLA